MKFLSSSTLPSVLKNFYWLALPLGGSAATSSYLIYSKSSFAPTSENNYLARAILSKFDGNNLHGKNFSYSDENQRKQAIAQDVDRLNGFFRKYDFKDISVSSGTSSSSDAQFYLHVVDNHPKTNPNLLWIDNFRTNQISIDRYGYEYDENGVKTANSNAKIHSLVPWQNIDLDSLKLEGEDVKKPTISLRFFEQDIPKKEVEILTNTDEAKYKIDVSDSAEVSKDWFVWLDKGLLTLKLNYALQTYVFNQEGALTQTGISSILGDATKRNDDQKLKLQQSKYNFESLDEKYKTFAKNYIKTFIDTSATDTSTNWSSVVNSVLASSSFIKTDDLNKIHNRFKQQKHDLSVFQPHLITKVTSGTVGNWKISLNLEKEGQDGKTDAEKEYEARDLTKLSSGTAETETAFRKNAIKLNVDPDTNQNLRLNDIFDWVKNYSIRSFMFSDKYETISSTYSSNQDKTKEALNILQFQHSNEFGIYVNQQWIPIIVASLFLTGIILYLITTFKGSGAIVGMSVAATAANVVGTFFALGSSMSLVGVFAVFVGILYSLFLGYYLLSFLKKIFSIEFLDASNVWAVFKRGMVMSTDISLSSFIFSTFLAFFAPLKFREFGIVLSLFVIFSFLCVSMMGCLMALQKAYGNFSHFNRYFNGLRDYKDRYLFMCDKVCRNKIGLLTITGSVLSIFIICGIIFLLMGWNSFSLFRENVLLIPNSSSVDPSSDLSSSNIPYVKLPSKEGFVYLAKSLSSLASFSSTNTIIPTKAFSDRFLIQDISVPVVCSYVLLGVYVFIRFKFRQLLVLLSNTSISLMLFVSILLLSRVNLSSASFLAICSFLFMSIVYNVMSFSFDHSTTETWYSKLSKDIQNRVYGQILISIVWLVATLSITGLTFFWMISVYLGLSILLAHFMTLFFIRFFSVLVGGAKNLIDKRMAHSVHGKDHSETSLDLYDEEIIDGINRRVY